MPETFIVGSGSSLLSLTKEEIHHINQSDLVISFNKYLLFYEKTGIIPHFHVQSDLFGFPSLYVFISTLQASLSDEKLAKTSFFFGQFPAYVASFFVPESKLSTLEIDRGNWKNPDKNNWNWARKVTDPLFHFRGTLTTIVNLATCIRPSNAIKLLGVDLSDHRYFFHDEFEKNRCLQDWTYSMMKKERRHSNVIKDSHFDGLSQESAIPWMKSNIESAGGTIHCCNSDSFFVQKGLLDLTPVISKSESSFNLNSETHGENTESKAPRNIRFRKWKTLFLSLMKLSIRFILPVVSLFIHLLPDFSFTRKLKKVV